MSSGIIDFLKGNNVTIYFSGSEWKYIVRESARIGVTPYEYIKRKALCKSTVRVARLVIMLRNFLDDILRQL